jgi:hypothetical protein
LNLSGLLLSLQDEKQEQKVSIIKENTLDVLIGPARFEKAQLDVFIEKLYMDSTQKLESLIYNYPLEKISSLLHLIGSERIYQSSLGYSFLDVFTQQLKVISPNERPECLLANHIASTNPTVMSTGVEIKTYLLKCDELLMQLLVLIHVFGGAPPRATELLTISLENTHGALRNVYVENGKKSI